MITLDQLLHHLAPNVLVVAALPAHVEQEQKLVNLVIYDGADDGEIHPSDLVLGIGLRTPGDVTELLTRLRDHPPVALIAPGTAVSDDAAVAVAAECGVALLGTQPGTSWMQLILLLRTLLGEGLDGSDGAALGVNGDLFAVAEAVAALVDAPVTIEDPQSRVLAFSAHQDQADAARITTILGRQGPADLVKRMSERGIFRKLRSASKPIFVPGRPPDILPRTVVSVRAGGEFLGSVWVAVREPLPPAKERALAETSPMVALHLLRHRLSSSFHGGLEVAHLSSVLNGGRKLSEAARRLNLAAPGYQVMAASSSDEDALTEEATLLRVTDLLRLGSQGLSRHAVVGKLGRTVYMVVPLPTASAKEGLRTQDFMIRSLRQWTGGLGDRVLVGFGNVVGSIGDVPRSRAQADQVIEVLRGRSELGPVADIETVGAHALLYMVSDACAKDPGLGAGGLRRLREHDEKLRTQLAPTLEAWLENFGNIERTAADLFVHPNTVRYRLRQLSELGLVNIEDPTERLAISLHFRMERDRRLRSS